MADSDANHSPRFDDCWFLTGPTASGKTAVGIELALRLDAEIISIDSMALFRGLDIGTAKPTVEERKRVAHHLVDMLDPDEDSSVAQYLEAAAQAADDIRQRGRYVLFVGGSPLYLKALHYGLFDGPPADLNLRHELESSARQTSAPALHARLAAVDPQTAQRLHPNDTRRVVRALEVYQLTGRPISSWQTQFAEPSGNGQRAFALVWNREPLYQRIDTRVDQMFAAGWVQETADLLATGKQLSRTAQQAVGYPEVVAHLNEGVPLPETIERVKTKTRQFAKRQLTWFRSLDWLRPVPVEAPLEAAEIAQRIWLLGQQTADRD